MVPFCTNTGIKVSLKRTCVLKRGWVGESSGIPRTHYSHNEANTMSGITISAKRDWEPIGQLVSSSLSTPSRMRILFVKPEISAPECATLSCQPFCSTALRNIWLKKKLGGGMEQPTAKRRKRDAVGNLRELASELGP